MLKNPSHPIIEPSCPDGYSAIARMFADWCAKQGAKTTIDVEGGEKYVIAELFGPDGGVDRYVTALFDSFTGRFLRDGTVSTESEFHSVTTLKELANALRTGHPDGRGHQ